LNEQKLNRPDERKLWLLKTSICNEQTNEVFPQTVSMGPDYDWDSDTSVNAIQSNRPLAFYPNLKAFHLDSETWLTDLVSQGYIYTRGLLVSRKFKDVVDKYILEPHANYEAEVVYHGTAYEYTWMHFTEEMESRVDFAHSTFRFVDQKSATNSTMVFNGQEDLRKKCAELVHLGVGEIAAENIEFIAGTPRFDLFFFQLTAREILVSDQLASRLLHDKLSGFELVPTANVFTFA
jgi:hypothetical protein